MAVNIPPQIDKNKIMKSSHIIRGPDGTWKAVNTKKSRSIKSVHVVHGSDGAWKVKYTGASRASKSFHTKIQAIEHAKSLAKNAASDLYIHSINGSIRGHNSYGHDPFPPLG